MTSSRSASHFPVAFSTSRLPTSTTRWIQSLVVLFLVASGCTAQGATVPEAEMGSSAKASFGETVYDEHPRSTTTGTSLHADARVALQDVSFTARSDGKGYVVRVEASERIAAYGMPRLSGENELKWTLYNTTIASSFTRDDPEGPIDRLRTSEQDGHVILHFELNRAVKPDAYRDGASEDILLNLGYDARTGTDTPTPVPQPAATASSGTRSPDAKPETSSPPVETASTGNTNTGNNSSTAAGAAFGASQEARDRWRLDKIVIDAGHGGKDPGASANGIREKDIVLKVAKKLGGYIEENLGIDVVYTRTDDTFIELEERGRIANREGAKLFISIHINAAGSRSARGTETFFLGQHKTEAARKVMERENAVIRYEDNPEDYDDYDEQALVRQVLAQSAYMRQSEKLASLIESQFEDRVQRRSRGVHQAGFYVLWSASMPAVLVELGFLTNRAEARFLASERGQTYLASAIFRAVRDYKARYEKGIVPTSR